MVVEVEGSGTVTWGWEGEAGPLVGKGTCIAASYHSPLYTKAASHI
jgi:hypothetical protein